MTTATTRALAADLDATRLAGQAAATDGRALSADDLAVILRALDAYDATDARARAVREHLAPMLVQTPRHGIPLALVRSDLDPHRRVSGRVQVVAYGGHDCCEERPAFRVTVTNGMHTTVTESCTVHAPNHLPAAGEYVGGWGTVTRTIETLPA